MGMGASPVFIDSICMLASLWSAVRYSSWHTPRGDFEQIMARAFKSTKSAHVLGLSLFNKLCVGRVAR